jgi:hypothetical protein
MQRAGEIKGSMSQTFPVLSEPIEDSIVSFFINILKRGLSLGVTGCILFLGSICTHSCFCVR